MERNLEIERSIMNKLAEWKMEGNNLFDFELPAFIKIEINPRRGGTELEQTTGLCYSRIAKISISYGTDLPEALHTLLHEMCHLNLKARKHDKTFNRSFAHAAQKITGKSFNWNQPMRRLDTEIAVAFGSNARAKVYEQRNTSRAANEKIYKAKMADYKPGDSVNFLIKSRWGQDELREGTIIESNPISARVRIKTEFGEIFSRKINRIRRINA